MLSNIDIGKSTICRLVSLYAELFWQQWSAGTSSVRWLTCSFDRLHCEMYPNEKLLIPTLLMELREVVIHASAGGSPVWLLLRDVKVLYRDYYNGLVALTFRRWWIIQDIRFDWPASRQALGPLSWLTCPDEIRQPWGWVQDSFYLCHR